MPLSLTSVPTFEQYQSDPTVREKLNNYFRASGWQISGDVKFADQFQNAINTLKTNVDKANQQEVLSGGAQSSGFSGSNIDTAMKYGLVSGSITPDQNYYNDINQFTTQKAGGTGNYSWITAPQPFTPTKGANQYQLGDTKTTGGTLSTVIQPQNLTSPGAGMPKGSFTSTPDATHTLKAYDTNNNYATVYVKPGEYVPGVSLTPKPQDNLTSESFQKQSGADLTGTISPSTNNLSSEANVAANQTKLDIKGVQDLYNQSMSESQKQADTWSTQLSDLLGQETGKAAYTTQKTQELVDPLQKQLTSVNNQISALQAEQNQAHLDAQGKPMTLARLSGEEARIDAQYNSRIFTLTAQANSLMNNIELAQTQVKRAVDAIYAPIDESIAIKKAQLEAIQPIVTKYEKIQSMAVSNYLTQQQEELKGLKDDIKIALTEAIKNGVNDASVLDKIANSKTGLEALKILAENMPEKSGELLTPTEAAALNVPYGTTKEQAAQMGINPKDVKGILTPQEKMDTEIKLSKQVDTSLEKVRSALSNLDIMNSSIDIAKQQIANGEDIGSSSQAIINAFSKILDQNSVVREPEYARTPEGASLINKMEGFFTKLQSGGAGLTVKSLQEYVDTANALSESYKNFQANSLSRARIQAENYGLDLNNIITPQAQGILSQYDDKQLQSYYGSLSSQEKLKIDALFRDNPNLSSHDILNIVNGSFNEVGGDTNTATKVSAIPDGKVGGQCGHFVNQVTGLGVGDSYQSKIAKMNPKIIYPQPGMVFTMPSNGVYSEYGHVGIILSIKDGIATVKDSNWKGDEKVLTHQIPISKMTGFAYA